MEAQEPDLTPQQDPLKRQGKLFAGLIADFKNRLSQYPSDLIDGLNRKVLTGVIFIYFVSLSASITFGGKYGDVTHNWIGVGETLLLTSVNGIIMALLGSQPLLIVGATVPLLIFDQNLYQFCEHQEIEFLPFRFWIGFWMTVTGFIFAAFELVTVVKYLSRFTDEIYSILECTIYILNAFKSLDKVFVNHPLIESYPDPSEGNVIPRPNTALFSLILMIGTFLIAIKLKEFRNSRYANLVIRRMLGDFGIPISIALMILLDYLVKDIYTDKLTMPTGLSVTKPEMRGWIVYPLGNGDFSALDIFYAAPVSIIFFIPLFIEENICQLILSKPERKMKKGTGFHSDLFLSCCINFLSGIFGAPFMSPAVVRTISHTSALTILTTHSPENQPKIKGTIEQRVSALLVAIMVGLSVLLAPWLIHIPKSVLFGIFLYMGVSNLKGIQLFERILLMLMPAKLHPDVTYVKEIRTWKMHLYTLIQLVLLAILFGVELSNYVIALPFILMMLIPIRLYIIPKIFDLDELDALDGSGAHKQAAAQTDAEEGDSVLDFYEEAHHFPTHVDDEVKELHWRSISRSDSFMSKS